MQLVSVRWHTSVQPFRSDGATQTKLSAEDSWLGERLRTLPTGLLSAVQELGTSAGCRTLLTKEYPSELGKGHNQEGNNEDGPSDFDWASALRALAGTASKGAIPFPGTDSTQAEPKSFSQLLHHGDKAPTRFSLAPSDWPLRQLKWPKSAKQESEAPMVSLFRSFRRAESTLLDFIRSYFMFHGLDAADEDTVLEYLPTLAFVEAYIYALDDLNEELLQPSAKSREGHDLKVSAADGRAVTSSGPLEESWTSMAAPNDCGEGARMSFDKNTKPTFVLDGFGKVQEDKVSGTGCKARHSFPFKALQDILESRNLLTDEISQELEQGVEFWRLERELCTEMGPQWATETPTSAGSVTRAYVERALRYKSFDYRVLNLLMYKMRGVASDEVHVAFLEVSEMLVEIGDDLFDYEEDVLKNTFNMYRMLNFVYGCERAPVELAAYLGKLEAEYQQKLAMLPVPLARMYQERCHKATQEGGDCGEGRSPLGAWSLPAPIVNEVAYRRQCLDV